VSLCAFKSVEYTELRIRIIQRDFSLCVCPLMVKKDKTFTKVEMKVVLNMYIAPFIFFSILCKGQKKFTFFLFWKTPAGNRVLKEMNSEEKR